MANNKQTEKDAACPRFDFDGVYRYPSVHLTPSGVD